MFPRRSLPRLLLPLAPLLIISTAPLQAADTDAVLAPAHASDRVIVGFEAAATKRQRRRAVGSVGPASTSAASPIAPDVTIVELAAGQSVGQVVREMRARPGVAYAEPDYRVWPAATSDDPHYLDGDLWGMYGDETTPHVNRFGSGAGEAWAGGHTGSSSILVGIIDEGIALEHPELSGNIWRNPAETPDGADDDGNGYVDDVAGWDFYHDDATVYDSTADDHGTHVAGTIGARGGNGVGVAGVNWRVSMIPAKFMGTRGGYISGAVRALDYITDLKLRHDLEIVATNNSWTGGGYSQALNDAIDRGGDAGILFIAAAGNDGSDIDASPSYPASYRCITQADGSPRGWDCVIAVANLQSDGSRRPDSDWGRSGVDLGAPGTDILSTYPPGDGGYTSLSGTSMSTAHVSGAVALCAAADASLPARRLRELLLATSAPTDSLMGYTASGSRLDVGALVAACAPAPPPPSAVTVEVDDLDAIFRRFGTGWREGDSGYRDHHYWVPTRERTRSVYGSWRPLLAQAGWYDVRVYIPLRHATSHRASYRVRTSSGWVTRIRNQDKRRGTWVSLGIHHLTTTPIVQLADKTGEDDSLGRRLAFDAARFVPADGPPPTSVAKGHHG